METDTAVTSRTSSVSLLDRDDNVLAEIFITQNGNIPRNQIFFTSSDNGKVLPATSQNVFGPGFTITSNTYFGGQGIITFDGDITTVGEMAFSGCANLKSVILPEDGVYSPGKSMEQPGLTLIFHRCFPMICGLTDERHTRRWTPAEFGIHPLLIVSNMQHPAARVQASD